ncbi:membrane protein [Pseudomonas oryzihabitans]|nr:membrane protein [Pseudomonas psychrotolerans]KTT32442.1 membrane protein [Pseudomonas psychrotolerans]KTT77991.1 membrane protein [Pseudomonas psychrotolerans]
MRTQTLLRGSLALLLASSALLAQAAPMPTVKPLRGTVDSVQGDTLDVTTRSGAHQSLMLDDKTSYRAVSKANLDRIEANSFIGSAATSQPDGTLKALEVTVFEASLRGSGEGHYGWENADGSTGTMTNGTVGELKKANGRTLTVQYKGGEKQLVVPEDVPIAYVEKGDRSLLKPGAKVVLFPAEDGKHVKGVAIGKDGFTPPM